MMASKLHLLLYFCLSIVFVSITINAVKKKVSYQVRYQGIQTYLLIVVMVPQPYPPQIMLNFLQILQNF
jgi:hypothetical protein